MQVFRSLALAVWFVTAIASAASFEGMPVSKVLDRSGKNLQGDGNSTFTLTSEIYRVTTAQKVVPEPVFDCEDDSPGNGKSGDWKGFFEVTKEDKPHRLAQAIRGVGVETARRLIADGYFDNKPRSWKELKTRMKDADAEYQTGFSNEVVVTYGKENAVNLGYIVEGKCGIKTVLVEHIVPVRTFARNETRAYQVRIQNAPLISGENEQITVTFDGFEDSIHVSSYYNDYKVDRWMQNDTVVFDLSGSRKQVRPDNTLTLTATVDGGNLSVQVSDAGFDSDLGEDRHVIGKVQIDNRTWSSNKDLATFDRPLSKTSGVTRLSDLGIQIPGKKSILIYYELRIGSGRYHNGESSSQKKLKLKLN